MRPSPGPLPCSNLCLQEPAGRGSWQPPSSLLPLQKLEEELRLHKCSTRECIEQYYLDKLKQVCSPGVGTLPCPRALELGSLTQGPFCRDPWGRIGMGA